MDKPKILVVEKDDDIRYMIKIYFSNYYDVKIATTTADTLEYAQNNIFESLVIGEALEALEEVSAKVELADAVREKQKRYARAIFLDDTPQPLTLLDPVVDQDDFASRDFFDIEELHLRIKNAIDYVRRYIK